MLELIVRDYFSAYRWEHIKEDGKLNAIWYLLYCMIIVPLMMGLSFGRHGYVKCLLVAIPAVWIGLSASLHSMRLPKIMFLCPMDYKMRRQYIIIAFWFRMCFHTAIGALGGIATMLVGGDALTAIAIIINNAIFSFYCSGMNVNGVEKKIASKRGIIETTGFIFTLLLVINYGAIVEAGGLLKQKLWEQVLVGIAVVIQLLLTRKYATYWQSAVAAATDYEIMENFKTPLTKRVNNPKGRRL